MTPLDCPIEGAPLDGARIRWALYALLGLGVLLRLTRYLLNAPLWGDECFLAASFIDRDFAGLLEPLEYNMVAPPLFLWAELAAVRLFGYSELSLRLVPTLASLGSLGLFAWLARRWLAGWPQLIAVGIFAVSYYPIRHGNEVKPYSVDLLMALALLVLATEWLRAPQKLQWLYLLAAASAVALLSSFPAMFVAGGVMLALAPQILRSRDWRTWLAYFSLAAFLLASFAAVYVLSVRMQSERYDTAGLKSLWNNDFPPLTQPWTLPGWLLERHTSHMFAYPVGGAHYASIGTSLLVLAGGVYLWRNGRRGVIVLSAAPLAACLAAAALERYPYGGSARTMQFIAPAVCLLAGAGAAWLLASLRRREQRRLGAPAGLALLALIGGAIFFRDLTAPYKTIYDQQSREFAGWFWREQARQAELVCVKRDLQTVFDARHWTYDRTAVYQCYQQVFSDRHRAGKAPDWDAVAADHPLRCVLYNEDPVDQPEFQAWLDGMLQRYELRERREYRSNLGVVLRNAPYGDLYVVYEFVPKPDAPSYEMPTEVSAPLSPLAERNGDRQRR